MNTDEKFEPLFKSCKDFHNNACLNFQDDMSHGYIYGYKKAADYLVKKINKTGSEQDYLVYPIVFMYRQHIELLLKNLISLGRQFYENKTGHPEHHEIDKLWPIVKGFARQFHNIKDSKEFKFIEHILKELCETDPKSMSFRYAKNKDGKSSNPDVLNMNLRHFSEMINKVSEYLSTLEFGLNASIERKYEVL